MPNYGNENNESNSSEVEKEQLTYHEFINKLLKNIRDTFPEHPVFIKSLETIHKHKLSLVDDVVIFRNKLSKLDRNDPGFTKEIFNKELELAICVKSQELIHLYRVLPDNGFIPRPYYDEAKEKHLLHRKDDQKQWINWLHVQRELLIKNTDIEKNLLLEEKLNKVQKEIDRVSNLNDKELIENREIFGTNPEEFDAN